MSTPSPGVEIELDHFHHQPFQELTGRVRITGSLPAKKMELRVFWFTRGRGDEEAKVLHRQEISPHDSLVPFAWKLPPAPYSFAGKLITLAWAVEVVDEKEQSLDLVPFLLSPSGEEMQLEALKDSTPKGKVAIFSVERNS
ncbi:hypothetical protein [Roseibacillus persicicus]|uniref:Uncharacterized protein n=1 Tax=Roseibacillus persicicus TaxID=454148 RepID=A0A918TMD7_9BACT|nr:hypothetical protein [Roseibacillus persicicus]GHC55629.1 hypothetical protein GCM10007100_22870 [Roseibacillus persicicus]